MHYSEFQRKALQQLLALYSEGEARELSRRLVEDISGTSRKDWPMRAHEIPETIRIQLESSLQRMLQHEPLQYVTGIADFFGYRFHVAPGVLIPRPETEELVAWILEEHSPYIERKVLDIGSGSGCISISLQLKQPKWDVFAIDISEDALAISRENARSLGAKVHFIHHSAHDASHLKLPEKQDIIVSNPPYIPRSEAAEMNRNVVDFEPEIALFVPDSDPLLFYRSAIQMAEHHLKAGGSIYVEMHESLARPVQQLFEEAQWKHVLIRKDAFGKERMLRAEK